MAQDLEDMARAAVQLTRAAPLFDRLVDHVLAEPSLFAPRGAAEDPALRECLDRFFPEFRRLYGRLLLEHLGPSDAPAVLSALKQESVQRYLRALRDMEPQLCAGLNELGEAMTHALRQRLHEAERGRS